MKRILIGLVVAGVVVAALLALRPRPMIVEMATVERRDVQEFIAEEGKARLPESMDLLIDMPVSGTLESIPVEVGDTVAHGDVIARIETYAIEQQIQALRARVRQAEAQTEGVDIAKPKPEDLEVAALRVAEQQDAVTMAETEYELARIQQADALRERDRFQRLRDAGAISQAEMDAAQLALDAASRALERAEAARAAVQKGLEQARLAEQLLTGSIDDNEYMRRVYAAEAASLTAQIAALERDLAKTVVRAPADGVVLEKHVDARRVLPAGTPLLKLGVPHATEIEIDVLSEEVGAIPLGADVEIYGQAVGAQIHGTVARIYPSAFTKISALGIEQQRVRVIASVPEEAPRLRPGTRVDVRIITATAEDVPVVPERAVFREGPGWAVMTVSKGRAAVTPVEVGLSNDEWTEIRTPLAPGDTVITELKNDLIPGMRVRAPAAP